MKEPKYICLHNPHSSEWLLFHYEYGKEKYAPNYGTALYNGDTPNECIEGAIRMFDIQREEIEIGW